MVFAAVEAARHGCRGHHGARKAVAMKEVKRGD